MFTGLIEEIGAVQSIRHEGVVARLVIGAKDTIIGLAVGDSIAVDGACLTVTQVENQHFGVDLSPETLARTTLGDLLPGERVNLERPCRPNDRLGGHFVTGHIDGVGTILEVQGTREMWRYSFAYPGPLRPLLVEKGSVAVDGISLTVAGLTDAAFDAAIIPYTYRHTTLGGKQVGRRVNLETDLLGKYVIRYLEGLGSVEGRALITEALVREQKLA